MKVRGKSAILRAGSAVMLVAGGLSAAIPVAAQDLGNPLGFLRELREIPLPAPNLLPGLQPPKTPDAPPIEPGQSTASGEAADPIVDDALRPGSDPGSEAGAPAEEPAENAAAPGSPTRSLPTAERPASSASQKVPDPDQPPPDAEQAGEAGEAGEAAGGSRAATTSEAETQAGSAVEPADPSESSDDDTDPSQTISSHALRPLRLGVLAGRDVRATMNALDPVAEGLEQALGRSVEILPMASYRAMIDAQQSQRIDGGFYSAEAYARAQAQCRCLEPIVAPRAGDGTTAYYAIIVAAPESGIASVADLGGKVVATAAADSVAGRRMQMASLASEGFDLAASAASVRETASAEQAVQLVVEGEADAAFAWSSLEGDLAAGYSRGTLRNLVANGAIDIDEVAVVWRSPAIAHGPVALLNALPDNDKSRIEDHLLGLAESAPEAYDHLNPFYPGGYAAVEPDDYRGLNALAAMEVQRAERDPEATADRTGGVAD